MLNFDTFLDLPLIWGGLIGVAVFLYVLLDGFTLGVGILFPFAPKENCRNTMISSIAPFWDGNETWLILGGGGLFAAFPLAYAIVMPALYVPVLIMLFGLIFRGVAFEFRAKAGLRSRFIWDYAFHFGSLFAAFFQGMILGGIVQGFEVTDRAFSGGAFDWLTAFSVMCGIALVFGYALLGATWTIMKTSDLTQTWARTSALYATSYMVIFLMLVSLWVPFLNDFLYQRWFSWPNIAYLSPIPLLAATTIIALYRALLKKREYLPFFLSIFIFVLSYIGLVVGLFPWMVPYEISYREAAAAATSQSLLLIGTVIILPIILLYTGYCYYVFRGKSTGMETY